MTSISVYRRSKLPVGIKVEGHSGYAESGADIVCAAISVLVQSLYIGLTEYVHVIPDTKVKEDGAFIEIHWQNNNSRELNVLVETIIKALYETSRSYQNYVKFVEVSL